MVCKFSLGSDQEVLLKTIVLILKREMERCPEFYVWMTRNISITGFNKEKEFCNQPKSFY